MTVSMLFMRMFVLMMVLVLRWVFVLVFMFVLMFLRVLVPVGVFEAGSMFVPVLVFVLPMRMAVTMFGVSLGCRLWLRSIRGLAIDQHGYLGGLNSTSVDPLDVQLRSQIQCPYRCL